MPFGVVGAVESPWTIDYIPNLYPMKTAPEKIDIFLSVNAEAMHQHFNKNDPSPFYKRQLSHEFEEYINRTKSRARRSTNFEYKVTCRSEDDKQYTEPLIYAIRRHFSDEMLAKQGEFERFKRRNYLVLFVGLAIILLSHITIPMVLKSADEEGSIQSAILMGIDIFSWVMMWQPIDNLLFRWNGFLKEISTIKKLTEAPVIYTENTDK